jgi:hypothetical protein
MDPLVIDATDDSPPILFDASSKLFIIIGDSRPKNAGKFFSPVINWLMKFEGVSYWRKQEMQDDSTYILVFKIRLF